MGWLGGGKKKEVKEREEVKEQKDKEAKPDNGSIKETPTTSGNLKGDSVEVFRPEPTGPLPTDISVFEFGTVGASQDGATLAGYCPVSDEMEPCRWELLPAGQAEAPAFRILF